MVVGYSKTSNLFLVGLKKKVQGAFRSFKTTNHGESRIKSCIKYDLGAGFRLVTVNTEKMIWLLFVGNHDAADKWLDNNSGWTPIRAKNGEYTSVRNPALIRPGCCQTNENSHRIVGAA